MGTYRFGFPTAGDLSRQGWVGEKAAGLLPVLERTIRERCEPFTPLLVFLGGSAVHGELCGIEDPSGGRRVLSDLDLGAVTARRVPPEVDAQISEELVEKTMGGPSARVGLYYQRDLGRSDPTIGLVETTRHGYVLSGEASLLGRFRMPEPREIPPWEARRLLANRVLEWAAACGEGVAAPLRVYAAAKLHADVAAVRLIAGRIYDGGGYAARAAAIGSVAMAPQERARIDAWSRWRIAPRWSETPVGGDVESAAASEVLGAEITEAVRTLLRSLGGSDSAGRFLRPSGVRGRAWARAWKRWSRIGPVGLRGIGPRRMRRTPRVLLWEAAIEWVLGCLDRAVEPLDFLTGKVHRGAEEIRSDLVGLAQVMDHEGVD